VSGVQIACLTRPPSHNRFPPLSRFPPPALDFAPLKVPLLTKEKARPPPFPHEVPQPRLSPEFPSSHWPYASKFTSEGTFLPPVLPVFFFSFFFFFFFGRLQFSNPFLELYGSLTGECSFLSPKRRPQILVSPLESPPLATSSPSGSRTEFLIIHRPDFFSLPGELFSQAFYVSNDFAFFSLFPFLFLFLASVMLGRQVKAPPTWPYVSLSPNLAFLTWDVCFAFCVTISLRENVFELCSL